MKRVTLLTALVSLVAPSALFAAGILDASFSGDGMYTQSLTAACGTDSFSNGLGDNPVALQTDGKILLGSDCSGKMVVARLQPDGTPDASFSGGGLALVDYSGGYPSASPDSQILNTVTLNKIVVSPDGKIVLLGLLVDSPNGGDILAVRLNADGSRDNSFGDSVDGAGNHRTRVNFGPTSHEIPTDAAFDASGRLLIVSQTSADSNEGTSIRFGLARLSAAGLPDASFGTSGKVIDAVQAGNSLPTSLALLADDAFLVGGYTKPVNYSHSDSLPYDVTVVKYLANGNRDASFGYGGVSVLALAGDDYLGGMGLQSGNIVLCGNSSTDTSDGLLLARVLPNGILDASFGVGGISLQGGDFGDFACADMNIASSGKIWAAGAKGPWDTSNFAVARFNANGTPDTTLASGGHAFLSIDVGGQDRAWSSVLQADGRLIAAGSMASSPFDSSPAVIRITDTAPALRSNHPDIWHKLKLKPVWLYKK